MGAMGADYGQIGAIVLNSPVAFLFFKGLGNLRTRAMNPVNHFSADIFG
jgi:hypothetical protein